MKNQEGEIMKNDPVATPIIVFSHFLFQLVVYRFLLEEYKIFWFLEHYVNKLDNSSFTSLFISNLRYFK